MRRRAGIDIGGEGGRRRRIATATTVSQELQVPIDSGPDQVYITPPGQQQHSLVATDSAAMATTVNLELKVSTDSVGLTKLSNPLGNITLVATDVHPRVKCPITGMILEGAAHGRHVGLKLEPKRQVFNRSRKLFVSSEHDLVIQTIRGNNKMSLNTNEKRVPTGTQGRNPPPLAVEASQ